VEQRERAGLCGQDATDLPAEPPRPATPAFAGLLPATLPEHPLWPTIAARLGVEHGAMLNTGKRHRPIELSTKGLSLEEVESLASIRIACAVCRYAIHPIRRRMRNKAGRLEVLKTSFIALTCSLRESPGCSRSKPASLATAALVAAIAAHRQAPPPPPPAAPKQPPPAPIAPAPLPKPPVAARPQSEPLEPGETRQLGLRWRP
jgi:hypothetical protein